MAIPVVFGVFLATRRGWPRPPTDGLAIGSPLGFLFGKWLIEENAYHMPVTFYSAGIAVVIIMLVLLLTVSTQVLKVLKSNPVNGLKSE